MTRKGSRHCPLCRHALTASEYERVLGIQQAKERELRSLRQEIAVERSALKKERESLTALRKSLRAQYDQKVLVRCRGTQQRR